MTEPNPTRILILGATGYIGGSILTHLINHPIADILSITALVRKPYQASILKDAGVIPLLFKDLDDYETIYDAARDVDVVIAAASARHEGSAKACLAGLSERSRTTGQSTHYVHGKTSGASMIGDWSVTGTRVDEKTYSDISDNVFELEKLFEREEAGWSPVRSVNQFVVESGERLGVRTYIVVPPLIFGPGTGSFTLGFGQVHMIAQASLKRKHAVMVGAGSGVWSRIHILDLTSLYFLLTQAILEQKSDPPSGKTGYYFAENGASSWKSISEKIGEVGKKIGAFGGSEVGSMSLGEAKEEFGYGSERDAEGVVGSSARIMADKARQLLAWSPTRGEGEFLEEIEDVVTAMFQQGEAE